MEGRRLCLGCMNPKGDEEVCDNCGWRKGTPPESSHYLPPGTVIKERYLLGRVLGQGGFGITYLGWDQVLGTRVAVKEFMPPGIAVRTPGQATVTALKSGEMESLFAYGIDRFLDEARTLARFEDHPGVVSVKDVFQDNGTAYMVMQYLEGVTLNEYRLRKGGSIPYPAARAIMMPVLDTLREVHRGGILHRDISPDNIFLTREGTVKLLDFGAARFAMGERSVNYSVILKAGYAPEEQYRSRGRQGEYTDVYSVAATMYQLITGQLPTEALDRLAEDTLLPPSQLGVEIPPAAEAALMKALSVKAEQRYQSVAEFQETLLSIEEQDGQPVVSEPPVIGISFDESTMNGTMDVVEEKTAVGPAAPSEPLPAEIPQAGKINRQIKIGIVAAAVGVVVLTTGVWYAVGHNKASVPEPAATVASENADRNQSAATPTLVNSSAKVENPEENKNDEAKGESALPVDKIITEKEKPKKIEAPPVQEQFNNDDGSNIKDGYGRIVSPSGNVYEGEIKNGMPNGKGTIVYPDGAVYVGQVKDGNLNGHGTMTNPNGLKYVGEYKDNLCNGQGKLTSTDGNTYEGSFKDNLPYGRGTWTFPDGTKYIGSFIKGYLNGYGRAIYPDGSVYEGEWKDSKWNGHGKWSIPGLGTFTGEFKDGVPDGIGIINNLDGTSNRVLWKNGQMSIL